MSPSSDPSRAPSAEAIRLVRPYTGDSLAHQLARDVDAFADAQIAAAVAAEREACAKVCGDRAGPAPQPETEERETLSGSADSVQRQATVAKAGDGRPAGPGEDTTNSPGPFPAPQPETEERDKAAREPGTGNHGGDGATDPRAERLQPAPPLAQPAPELRTTADRSYKALEQFQRENPHHWLYLFIEPVKVERGELLREVATLTAQLAAAREESEARRVENEHMDDLLRRVHRGDLQRLDPRRLLWVSIDTLLRERAARSALRPSKAEGATDAPR